MDSWQIFVANTDSWQYANNFQQQNIYVIIFINDFDDNSSFWQYAPSLNPYPIKLIYFTKMHLCFG